MDDRLKESISALMDDEVNELELQRILSHSDHQELSRTWQCYHRVRDVLRHDTENVLEIDVRQAVSQWIEQGESAQTAADSQKEQLSASETLPIAQRVGGFLAIAASVAFAFFFVLQNGVTNGSGEGTSLFVGLDTTQEESTLVKASTGSMSHEPRVIIEFSAEHAQRLNAYLLRHSEHAVLGAPSSVMPLARVASVNSVGI